jgi:hypothetical protein
MRGAIPTLPQYIFMASCLVKHSDNFTFTFNTIVTIGASITVAYITADLSHYSSASNPQLLSFLAKLTYVMNLKYSAIVLYYASYK